MLYGLEALREENQSKGVMPVKTTQYLVEKLEQTKGHCMSSEVIRSKVLKMWESTEGSLTSISPELLHKV